MTTPAEFPTAATFSAGRGRLRRVVGLGAILLAVVVSAYLWSRPDKPVEPGAFLLPVDQTSRARLSGWRASRLTTTHPVPGGATVHIPDGSRVRIIHASGHLEEVAGPRDLTVPSSTSRDLDHFHSPLARVVAELQPNAARRALPVRITSPADLTVYLNPIITWDALPDAVYDVGIVDPADPRMPPRFAEKARPPVKFSDLHNQLNKPLAADRIHQVVIFEHGINLPLGTMQFLTSPDAKVAEPPTDLAALLAEATAALAKRPFRSGDAWIALERLPAAWAKSELALRLRMKAAAELGLEHELQEAKIAVGIR